LIATIENAAKHHASVRTAAGMLASVRKRRRAKMRCNQTLIAPRMRLDPAGLNFERIDHILKFLLWLQTDDPLHCFSVLEEDQRWDAADTVSLGRVHRLIDV
jgi:hypothetical protein